MVNFVDTRGMSISAISIPKNGTKRIRTNGLTARVATDIKLENGRFITATLTNSPFNGPRGQWTIDIKGTTVGTTTLKATSGNKSAAIDIEVFDKKVIQLPQSSTDEGLLARLFLAESINPSSPRYKEDEAITSMLWMRQVVENRKADSKPSRFAITATSNVTYKDVVIARNQFHGFESYPSLIDSIKNNLLTLVNTANNYNHPEREKYATFVNAALAAAKSNALDSFTDPSQKGLYGWRTKDSSAPGGDFVKHADLAGQTFYTLK
ncbi:hypothetical protein [Thaumasiovibrio subtropicus]|uniref:hypothetical protein n=1 Tax=Thaumasiovibrio subtropicus TaxID=1891207 RepID=UPI000B35D874|nr:hypothetical protein [Thaumasiovibrio subtropicus]